MFTKIRVTVEHIIGKIKIFRVLAERYRNKRKRYELRMQLICGIYNTEINNLTIISGTFVNLVSGLTLTPYLPLKFV